MAAGTISLGAFIIASLISSAVGAVSSITGSLINRQSQKEANNTNIDLQNLANDLSINETEKTRQWLTQMSNTAHQREMADLQAAGLNPILAAGGSGAPVTGASAAQVDAARVNAPQLDLSGINQMLSSLSNTMLTQALINDRFGDYFKQKGGAYESGEMINLLKAGIMSRHFTQDQWDLLGKMISRK